jgi:hypothetical protein
MPTAEAPVSRTKRNRRNYSALHVRALGWARGGATKAKPPLWDALCHTARAGLLHILPSDRIGRSDGALSYCLLGRARCRAVGLFEGSRLPCRLMRRLPAAIAARRSHSPVVSRISTRRVASASQVAVRSVALPTGPTAIVALRAAAEGAARARCSASPVRVVGRKRKCRFNRAATNPSTARRASRNSEKATDLARVATVDAATNRGESACLNEAVTKQRRPLRNHRWSTKARRRSKECSAWVNDQKVRTKAS